MPFLGSLLVPRNPAPRTPHPETLLAPSLWSSQCGPELGVARGAGALRENPSYDGISTDRPRGRRVGHSWARVHTRACPRQSALQISPACGCPDTPESSPGPRGSLGAPGESLWPSSVPQREAGLARASRGAAALVTRQCASLDASCHGGCSLPKVLWCSGASGSLAL